MGTDNRNLFQKIFPKPLPHERREQSQAWRGAAVGVAGLVIFFGAVKACDEDSSSRSDPCQVHETPGSC